MKVIHTEVAIVGAGPAGLAAAVAAAERGAEVAVFEKGFTTGGTGNMGMGLFAVESRHQRLRQMGPSREEAFRVFMDFTHWQVDARLVRAYIDKSADTIEWLEAMGVEFLEPMAYFPGGWPTWHLVKPGGTPGCAANMYRIMTQRARALGVRFFFNTPAKALVRDGDEVTGLWAEDREGELYRVRAKAVVIATGGFGDNPQWIEKYTGFRWGEDLFSFRIPGLKGDGIRMAWEVGAAPSRMGIQLIYIMPGEVHPEVAEAFRQPHLLVNVKGQRFVNEGIMFNSTFIGNAISQQPGGRAFLIFDEAIKEHMKTVGLDFIHVPFPYFRVERFDELFEGGLGACPDVLFVARSLDELARKAGIDVEGLREQLERYNEYCRQGFDPEFDKPHRYLRPLTGPRYYAGRLAPGGYGTLGGIRIDHRCRVLGLDHRPIRGLFAAGTDANSINFPSYVFFLPGNTMGFAVNSGRIAGEEAAALALGRSRT